MLIDDLITQTSVWHMDQMGGGTGFQFSLFLKHFYGHVIHTLTKKNHDVSVALMENAKHILLNQIR